MDAPQKGAAWVRDQPGMTAACATGAAVRALVFGLGLAGCLVTDKIEYADQDLPPRIIVLSPGPVQAFPGSNQCGTEIGGEAAIDGSKGGPWVKFMVSVSDPNVDDVLDARLLINGVLDGEHSPLIPNTETVDRGTITFCVTGARLQKPCNLVQLIVMRRDDFDFRNGGEYGINLQLTDKYALQSWVVLSEENKSGLCQLDFEEEFL